MATTASVPAVARFYVTTPIYYVNDAPHIGHAYTTVTADALARWHRLLRRRDVWFLTGTDEHGLKVAQAAEQHGVTPREWADTIGRTLPGRPGSSSTSANDDFIRTTEPRHYRGGRPAPAGLLRRRRHRAGHLRRPLLRRLRGLLHRGRADRRRSAPSTTVPVESVTEENYFFKLSRFEQRLLDWYDAHPDAITPETRRNEVLGFIRQGLQDFSISRTSLTWGVPIPWDPAHVTYVWFDAPHQLHHRRRLRPRRRALRHVVAGQPPPHRQGHHPLPLRLLAGHAAVRRARAARRLARARLAARRRREDVQDPAQPDRPGRPGRDVRGRRLPLPLPARPQLRARQRLLLRGDGRPLQHRPGQQPRQPARPGGHGGGQEVRRHRARSRRPTRRWPPSPRTAVDEAATKAWADVQPNVALEATWRIVRETNAHLEANEPWKAEPGPAVDAVMGDALEALRIVAVLASPAMPDHGPDDLGAHRSGRAPWPSSACPARRAGADTPAGCRS